MDTKFDLIVLGGGPGGYVAAIRAAQLGMKAAVVEREHLGGICLNWGCIPTKALLRSSEINHMLHHLDEYGFAADNIRYDLPAIVKRSRGIAKQLASGVGHLLKKNKVPVFFGQGRLAGPQTLTVVKDSVTTTLTAPHIMLATGARARQLPGLESDGHLIWSYREAMVPAAMPKSLLVIGSGAIGIEFASFYRNMGAEVTIVEVLDRILQAEDEEIGAFARKSFEKQGIKGPEAREALRRHVLGQPVTLTSPSSRSHDDYGRLLARVDKRGEDVGRWMVRRGQAWSYSYRRNSGPYATEQAQAQAAGVGLFAHAAAENPRNFRQRHGSCYP